MTAMARLSEADSSIKSLEELKGKTIGVIAGSTGDAWAKANSEKLGVAEVKSYAAQQDLLMEVQNGRIDGGAGELAGFQYAMTKMPGFKLLVRIPTGERFALMAKKDSPLVEKVSETISGDEDRWHDGGDPQEVVQRRSVSRAPARSRFCRCRRQNNLEHRGRCFSPANRPV